MPWSRRQSLFLLRFFGLLAGSYAVLSLTFVDRTMVVPFTNGVAHVSGVLLRMVGSQVRVMETIISDGFFAVDIKNGCNGLEVMLFLGAAILAFEAPWKTRVLGALAGMAAVQLLNAIRVASLFLLGRHHPRVFEMFHLAVWQTLMFAAAVFLFLYWTSRVTANAPARR